MHENIDYNELESHEERTDHLDYGPLAHGQDQHELLQEAPGEDVSQQMIENDVSQPDRWLTYNKGYEQIGYSPADVLDTTNVDSLSREWTYETNSQGLQTNPIVIPGDPPVMYFTQNNQVIRAVNARTGDEYWNYQFALPEDPGYFLAHRLRGVGIYDDTVVWGTATAQLLAHDRSTGEIQWQADGMPAEVKEAVPYDWAGYGIPHAPMIYDDKIYVGQTGGDSSEPGFTFTQAFDVNSGNRVWQHQMAPQHRWAGDTWKHGNASGWMAPAIDPDSDTVFWNSGNAGPMLNGWVRPGPNEYTGGIVALDAQTGEKNWNSQHVKHEMWDYDGQYSPMLHQMEVDGETRKVVSCDHKTGWTFVFDIETGELLERSEPWAKQDGVFLEMLPQGRENAEPLWPAITGGTNWPPDTFSPDTGRKYIGAQDYVVNVYFTQEWEMGPDAGVGGGFTFPEGLGDEIEQWGGVRSVNPATGEVEWEYEYEDYPVSAPLQFNGGTTSTAGGLVFGGSAGGNLVALDADSGNRLWRDATGGRITASPVTWSDPATGTQYVTVAADDTIITYAGN